LLSASAVASDAKLALDGLDPVELIQGQTAKGQPQYSAERGDFRYLFKSEENRSKFASDPEKYGLQLNGKCVLSDTMPGSQKLHTVVDGRIYLGGTEHCIERFKESPGTFVDVKTGKRLAMRTDSPPQDDRQKVAILIFEGVQIIDYTGPYEVFGEAGFNVYTVAEKPGTLTTAMGMKVTPNCTFDNAPVPDVLVTPGGNVDTGNAAVVEWVKTVAPKSKQVMSVCNGAFWLAKAGLLEGQSATTFHAVIDALRESAPNTKVVSDKRYVDNGKVITTAGLSSGIDGALYVVSKMQGFGAAQAVALGMEYNWDPKSTYARAALADKPIRFLRWPSKREGEKHSIVETGRRYALVEKELGGRRRWGAGGSQVGGGIARRSLDFGRLLAGREPLDDGRWRRQPLEGHGAGRSGKEQRQAGSFDPRESDPDADSRPLTTAASWRVRFGLPIGIAEE
jgi:putative intracellular protease/amidase/YHS domain-containing protein